jgi:hypothetical protein
VAEDLVCELARLAVAGVEDERCVLPDGRKFLLDGVVQVGSSAGFRREAISISIACPCQPGKGRNV